MRHLLFLLIVPFLSYSQSGNLPFPAGDDSVTIYFAEHNGRTQFSAGLRPLRQIAGAPEAFYTYYWEFGDGTFSFDEMPVHAYATPGEYEVRLYATNNYDDGKAPPSRAKKYRKEKPVSDPGHGASTVQSGATSSGHFNPDQQVMLKTNRMPRPDEEMVLIVGYRSHDTPAPPVSGTLALFFNEKDFAKKNFEITDIRTWHGEQEIVGDDVFAQAGITAYLGPGQYKPSGFDPRLAAGQRGGLYLAAAESEPVLFMAPREPAGVHSFPGLSTILAENNSRYADRRLWRFEGLEAGAERFFFITLKTTPEMIRDTNAIVTMNMTLIPDDPSREVVSETLEMQIVVSHDPNKASVNNRLMNYRFIGKEKELKYKVRFQNTGKGPASLVDIGVSLSDMVDLSSIRLVDQYPECPPCEDAYAGQSCLDTVIKADSVHFIFRNIYLPGKRQLGVNDADSTKGFVEFYARLKEKPPKLPFYTQAAIVFDRNEPIITNRAYNRFLPGISPAIVAGYGWSGGQSKGSFILGGSIAPYSPYKIFFQAEAYLGIHQKSRFGSFVDHQWDDRTGPERVPQLTLNDSLFFIASERVATEREMITLDLVPLHVRKNWSDRFATGVGMYVAGSIHRRSVRTEELDLRYFQDSANQMEPGWGSRLYTVTEVNDSKAFASARIAPFADISFGRVRVGPSVGLRYLHFISSGTGRFMFYTTWRL